MVIRTRVHRVLLAFSVVCALLLSGMSQSAPAATTITDDPATVAMQGGKLAVFARGSDGALWWRMWTGSSWRAWESLGGGVKGTPAAVSWNSNHIDVFVRGTDDRLYHRFWNGSGWYGWEQLGDWQFKGDPKPVSPQPGHIEVFARGLDDSLIGIPLVQWMGGWSHWRGYGGVLSADPEGISWGANHMDIFVRGSDLKLHHRWWGSGGWSGWGQLGDYQLSTEPGPMSWGSGHIDVFARGLDNALVHHPFLASLCGWCGWQHKGGYLTSEPKGISWGNEHQDVFYRGGGGDLWHRYFIGGARGGGGWSGEHQLVAGNVLAGQPRPVSYGEGHIDVFARGYDGALWHKAHVAAYGGWGGWESLGIPDRYPSSTRYGGSLDSEAEINSALAFLDSTTTRSTRWSEFTDADKVTLASHDVYVRWGQEPGLEQGYEELGSYDHFDHDNATVEQAQDWVPQSDTFENLGYQPVAQDAIGPAIIGIVAGCARFCPAAGAVAGKVFKGAKRAKPPRMPVPRATSPSWWVARVGSNPSTRLRRTLEGTSEAQYVRSGWAAHHIVPVGHRHARRVQQYLSNCSIDPNAAVNGVMLPETAADAGSTGRQAHRNLHTNHYMSNLQRAFFTNVTASTAVPGSKGYCDVVLGVLSGFKTALQNGTMPH